MRHLSLNSIFDQTPLIPSGTLIRPNHNLITFFNQMYSNLSSTIIPAHDVAKTYYRQFNLNQQNHPNP